MSIIERAYNAAIPDAEELWDRGGATMTDGAPYFTDLEIVGDPKEYAVRPLYMKDRFRRRRIGTSMLLGYTMSDGLDRLTSVRTLDDKYRSDADMLATTSTAWTTTVAGYAGRRDERIARQSGIQTVTIGAPGSTNERMLGAEQLAAISLAKDAQSEQAILADLSGRFDLPTVHYSMGDSRGAMIKPGHLLYAPSYGNEVIFTDTRAPCVPDKLEPHDMPKIGLWLGVEALGLADVVVSLAKDRDVGLLLGTFDAHPRSLSTSFGGIMPALMSGEAGRLAELAPNDMRGHVVLYGHDILSMPHRWHEIYGTKPDVTRKDVPRGSHAHLLQRTALQLERIGRTVEQWQRVKGEPNRMDWDYVVRGDAAEASKKADLRLII